jgi:hypothetical protein
MKKLILLIIPLFLAFLFVSCEDTGTDPIDPGPDKGSILISSTPAGASILVNNQPTGKVTPDSVTGLNAGTVSVTLQLAGYRDTTFSMTVAANMQTPKAVTLTQNAPDLQTYTNIRLHERASVSLSGLDLSEGDLTASTGAATDIYFDGGSGSRDLRSQHLRVASGGNETYFYLGTGTNLQDGTDSPVYQASTSNWIFQNNGTTNYVFLYDKDNHYSKLIITGTGQSGPIDERWVEVTYIYNKTENDPRF